MRNGEPIADVWALRSGEPQACKQETVIDESESTSQNPDSSPSSTPLVGRLRADQRFSAMRLARFRCKSQYSAGPRLPECEEERATLNMSRSANSSRVFANWAGKTSQIGDSPQLFACRPVFRDSISLVNELAAQHPSRGKTVTRSRLRPGPLVARNPGFPRRGIEERWSSATPDGPR